MATAPASGAYREHYIPDAPDARPARRRLSRTVRQLAGFFLGVVIGQILLAAFFASSGPVATPIPAPAIVAKPLPSLGAIAQSSDTQRVIDIRTEAFRAGLQEGLGQGCNSAPLAPPIAR